MRLLSSLFSERGSGVSFRSIEDASFFVTPLPDFIFGHLPENFSKHWYELYGLHSAGVISAEHTGIKFPYIPFRNGENLSCAEANLHESHLVDVIALSQRGEQPKVDIRHFSGQHVLLAGPGFTIYGHWVIDFLPKLQILELSGYDLSSLNFLLPSSTPEFAIKILSLFGISLTQLQFFDESTIATTDNLLIPTTCHNGIRYSRFFADFGSWARERVSNTTALEFDDCPSDLIFLGRGPKFRNRNLLNRSAVESCAINHGFRVVYPEDMTLVDQWALFAKAGIIVGEYGSALHSSVFGSAALTVCALHGPQWHPGFVQTAIGQSLRQPTGYVMGTGTHESLDAPYEVDLIDFSRCIEFLKRRPTFPKLGKSFV